MKLKSLFLSTALSVAFAQISSAATIDLGWSSAGLPDGALATWTPSANTTGNAGIMFTGGTGGTVQSGSSNLSGVNNWVNTPGYNLAANPNDSWHDGLGDAATKANASWEMVVRPGDFTGKHTLFNTGGNGSGLGVILEGGVIDFRFQSASSDDRRVIAKADLSVLGVASDFFHVVGVGDVTSNDSGTASIWVNGALIDTVTSVGDILDGDGGDLAELGKGGNIPGASPFNPDAFTGDIASFNYYGGQLLTGSEIGAAYGTLVPEPSTGLLLMGSLLLGFVRRRR